MPDNADTGWIGGFDVVLSNPPWERLAIQEKEWFARYNSEIVNATNASQRKRMIDDLQYSNPTLYQSFIQAQRIAEGKSHFLHNSGRYPLCGHGQINLYAVFAEMMRQIVKPTGRIGCIVQSGIATDDTTKRFFHDIIKTRTLVSLYDFDNTTGLFPGVDSRQKFCLLTMNGSAISPTHEPDFAFFLHDTRELADTERRFSLSIEDISLINPNTFNAPVIRNRRDARLLKETYGRFPILIKEGPLEENLWGIKFIRMFDMANDSHLFRTCAQLEHHNWKLHGDIFYKDDERYLPLYEGKMISFYDHRFATYEKQAREKVEHGKTLELTAEQHQKPDTFTMPYYWIPETEFAKKCAERHAHAWLAFRDVAHSTNVRTAIISIIPALPCGHKLPIIFLDSRGADEMCYLASCCSSFIFDYLVRQKMGGTSLSFFIFKQLPVPPPSQYQTPCPWEKNISLGQWLLSRTLELTYTAWDLAAFAADCGYHGPPFHWDEERRFLLRCELDAAYFHLYGIARDDVDYIMETFRIWKEKEEKQYGLYRTKYTILEMYDAMQDAQKMGIPYQTRLDPPPANRAVAHVMESTIPR